MRLVLAALVLGALPLGTAHAADGKTCQGKPATIVDLDGGDVLGTDGDDVIVVGPDVTVLAGGGHDTVCVLGTDDSDYADIRDAEDLDIDLRGGYDTLFVVRGGAGGGVIDGGADSATVTVIPDRSVFADLGDEELSMDGDSTYTFSGFDTVLASAKRVRLLGSSGPDHLRALNQSCKISVEGGPGRDWLAVAPNTIDAPPISCNTTRAPELLGKGGNDLLVGYRRNDRLFGGPGRDTAKGGFGRDTCRAEIKQTCER